MEEDFINAVRSELETEEHEDGHLSNIQILKETSSGDS